MQNNGTNTLQYSYSNPRTPTLSTHTNFNNPGIRQTMPSFAARQPQNKPIYVTPSTTANYNRTPSAFTASPVRVARAPLNYASVAQNDGGIPTTYKKSFLGGPETRYISNNQNTFATPKPVILNQPQVYNPSTVMSTTPTRPIGRYIKQPGATRVPALSPQRSPQVLRGSIGNVAQPMIQTIPSNQVMVQQAPGSPGNTYVSPVVERKLIYVDPVTGARMMKVCTPEGTIKRVECLDEVQEQENVVNNYLDQDTSDMIRDAKREFKDPNIDEFDCDECKKILDFFNKIL